MPFLRSETELNTVYIYEKKISQNGIIAVTIYKKLITKEGSRNVHI